MVSIAYRTRTGVWNPIKIEKYRCLRPTVIKKRRKEMEERMKRLEAAQKELEDSFIVMTHLETKMSNVLKEQAEYVASHEDRLRTHGSRLHDHEAIWRRIETGLAEATDKINFLIDREMRREGGLESR